MRPQTRLRGGDGKDKTREFDQTAKKTEHTACWLGKGFSGQVHPSQSGRQTTRRSSSSCCSNFSKRLASIQVETYHFKPETPKARDPPGTFNRPPRPVGPKRERKAGSKHPTTKYPQLPRNASHGVPDGRAQFHRVPPLPENRAPAAAQPGPPPPPRHLGKRGAGSGPEPPHPHRARGAAPRRRAGTKGAEESPRPSGREGGVSGRARARGGRGRPGQSARRESPRTRARAAGNARGRARARIPHGARGYHTGRRKGHKTLQGRRVRAEPGREARRAARPPRAHGTGLVGTGSGQGSLGPPAASRPWRPPPGPHPRPRPGGREGTGRRPGARGGGGAARQDRRPEEAGAATRKRLEREKDRGVERTSTTHPSIAHTGDPRGTEWRHRNSRNRPNGSEL